MVRSVIVTSFPKGTTTLRDPVVCLGGRSAEHVADRHCMLALLDDPWRHLGTRWDVGTINGSYCLDPAMRSLQVKVGFDPSRRCPGADVSLWVDPDVEFREDLDLGRLFELYGQGSDLLAFRHPTHSCAYALAEELCSRFPLHAPLIREQVDRYRRDGLPEGGGLLDTSALLRRHTAAVRATCELWWRESLLGYPDPSLTLAYALHRTGGARTALLPGEVGPDFTPYVVEERDLRANANPYFRRRP